MGLLTEKARGQFDQNEENYSNDLSFFSCRNNHKYSLKQGKAYSVPYKGNSILVRATSWSVWVPKRREHNWQQTADQLPEKCRKDWGWMQKEPLLWPTGLMQTMLCSSHRSCDGCHKKIKSLPADITQGAPKQARYLNTCLTFTMWAVTVKHTWVVNGIIHVL